MSVPVPLADLFTAEDWLALLEVSLTAIHLVRPLYAPDAPAIVDFALEYLNPAAQRMTGLPEQPGGTVLSRFPHVLATGVFRYYQRVFETGETLTYETNYQADGLDNYFKLRARRSGAHLLVSFTDTSDQNRSAVEQALRASQAAEQAARADADAQRQRLTDFMSAAPGIVLSMRGPQHVIEFANAGFRQQFGVPDPIGQPYLDALPGAADQYAPAYQATDLYDHIYRTGEPFYTAEAPYYVFPPHAGPRELRYFAFAVQAARDGRGHITGVQAYASDVTAQVQARQQMESLNQELEARVAERTQQLQAAHAEAERRGEELATTNEELFESNTRLTRTNNDLDTFVYTASHDLKAPITNIESILGALRDTLPAAVQQEEVVAHLMGLLAHTVDRFRTTIDQLTDLTRLQHTYNEPAELLLLAPIIAGVVQDLSPQLTAAQAELHLVVPAGLRVSFAPASLRSIVYNLLSNAIKYHDPARPAQVWLQAEQRAGDVVLRVRDNGLGLTELQQQRLFGAFQRLHTHVEGTGVGLYMIKRLIDNAGARIAVASTLGVGSIFTVTFSS